MLSVLPTLWSVVILSQAGAAVPVSQTVYVETRLDVPRLLAVDSTKHPTSKSTDSTKVDTIYTCPMDPQVIKHEPGNCPVCGMKLVKKAIPRDTTAKADTTKKKNDVARSASATPYRLRDSS